MVRSGPSGVLSELWSNSEFGVLGRSSESEFGGVTQSVSGDSKSLISNY